MKRLILSLIFSLVLMSTPAMGQIYKWVDKDGGIHFSDAPTDSKYQYLGGAPQKLLSPEDRVKELIRIYAEKILSGEAEREGRVGFYTDQIIELMNSISSSGQPNKKIKKFHNPEIQQSKSNPSNSSLEKEPDYFNPHTGKQYNGGLGGIWDSQTGEFLPGGGGMYFSPWTGQFIRK